ncbi:MAG: hypothetical protein PUE57_05465, partial [Lactimicrobium massiliense]
DQIKRPDSLPGKRAGLTILLDYFVQLSGFTSQWRKPKFNGLRYFLSLCHQLSHIEALNTAQI